MADHGCKRVTIPIWLWSHSHTFFILFALILLIPTFQLVFSSSATVYGSPKKVPCTEEFPISALNPYGRTKVVLYSFSCKCFENEAHLRYRWCLPVSVEIYKKISMTLLLTLALVLHICAIFICSLTVNLWVATLCCLARLPEICIFSAFHRRDMPWSLPVRPHVEDHFIKVLQPSWCTS